MSAIRYRTILGALFVAGSVAVGCGGVDPGIVNIVDEEGGSGGSGAEAGQSNGANGGSSGKSQGDGGAAPAEGGTDGEGGEAGEGTVPVLPEPPVVVSITPGTGDEQAEPTDSISIEFSEGLDPDSVTGDSVLVFDGETAISGELTYSGVTVEFVPDQRLDLLGEYSVVVTTDITDAGGTALAEDFSSSFTVRDGQWSEELLVPNAAGTLLRTLVSPVIDAAGNALIVWGQAKAGQNVGSVFGRYFSPEQGFGEPFEIDRTDVACDDLSVSVNAAGDALVAWTEKRGAGEEVWARRISGGEPAGAPQRVDVAAATNVAGTASAVSVTGEAQVLWWFNDAGATMQNILASHAAAGEAWLSTPEIIFNYADTLSPPALAFDDDGNGFVFFAFDSDGSDQTPGKLYVRRYLDTAGRWGNGTTIDGSDEVRLYDPPSVVTDSKGGARAVFTAGQDVKSVAFSKAGGFSAASTIDVLELSPNSVPQLASNGSRFLAAWYQSASLNSNAYSVLSDGGAFATPELRSSGDLQVGYYGNAVCGVDRHGNGLVLLEQGNATGTVDMVFGRLSAKGDEWADGARVNSLEGEYQDPRLAVAANGVAVAAWSVGIRLSATAIYVSTFE